MADGVPLKEGRTNTVDKSQVDGLVAPAPLLFLRTDTGEIIAVPAEDSATLRSQHMSLCDLVAELESANRAVAYIAKHRVELTLQSVQGLSEATIELDTLKEPGALADKWQEEAQKKLDEAYRKLDVLGKGGTQLVELIALVEKKNVKSSHTTSTATATKGPELGNDYQSVKAKLRSFKSAVQLRDAIKYPKYPQEKVWYAHSPTIKPTWPKFKDDVAWKDVHKKDANGKRKINPAKLAEYNRAQLKKLKASSDDVLQALGYKKAELEASSALADWAENWNRDANWSHENSYAPGGHKLVDVDLSAEAAVMRYAAGAGLNASFNPFKKGFGIKAEGHAELSLAEARAQALLYCPGEDGLMLYFLDLKGARYDMGAVRLMASLTISGVVGASISAEAGVAIETRDREPPRVKGRHAKRRLTKSAAVNQKPAISETGAEAKIFAGAKADAELKGAVEWRDPETKDKRFVELASVAPTVGAMAGLGGEATLKIEYVEGKFRLTAHASLCFGIGAEGAVSLAVNVVQLASFQKWLAYQLLNVNFHNLEIIAKDAFDVARDLAVLAVQAGHEIATLYGDSATKLRTAREAIVSSFIKAEERRGLAHSILFTPSAFRYAPPEAKGILLYALTRHSYADYALTGGLGASYLRDQRQAVLHIIKSAQTRREVDNIIQHMHQRGDKGILNQNYNDLHAFFRTETPHDYDLPLISSPYDDEFQNIYRQLPADAVALNGDFGTWYHQFYGYLREEPARGYAMAQVDTTAYALLKDQLDHSFFASSGGRAYYGNLA